MKKMLEPSLKIYVGQAFQTWWIQKPFLMIFGLSVSTEIPVEINKSFAPIPNCKALRCKSDKFVEK